MPERFHKGCDAVLVHSAVCVDGEYQFAVSRHYPGIHGKTLALPGLSDVEHREIRAIRCGIGILGQECLHHLFGIVRRGIVDKDHLDMAITAVQHRLQRSHDPRGLVAARDDD